jgi:hypothetical protein
MLLLRRCMQAQEATDVFRRYCLRQAAMRGMPPGKPSSQQLPELGLAGGSAGAGGDASAQRPTTAQSVASASRPFSAAASAVALAGAILSYQSFCAAVIHVAAKLARGSAEMLEGCPFLSVSLGASMHSQLVTW